MNLATQSEGIWPGVPTMLAAKIGDICNPFGAKRRWGFLILTDSLVGVKFLFLSHRSSFELNSVSIVNQPIHNGIGDGRVPDMIMPMIHRELAGDEGGRTPTSLFDHFEQISPFGIRERG